MPTRPAPPFLKTLALLAIGLAVSACGAPEAPSAPGPTGDTLRDGLGREIALAEPARRVLTLAPSLTEAVAAVGALDRLVGASQADDYPAEVADLPRFSTYPLDYERVVALEPDLVLATDQINSPGQADPLARAGIPTWFFRFNTLADVPSSLRRIGALLGEPEGGERAATDFEQRLADVRAAVAPYDRPRVLVLIGQDDPLYGFGQGSYVHEMVTAAGGRSVSERLGEAATVYSEEFVFEERPEVIVGLWGPAYAPGSLLETHPSWAVLPALVNGRVFSFDPDLFSRPGPRLIEGIEGLARRLHPEAFAEGVAALGP